MSDSSSQQVSGWAGGLIAVGLVLAILVALNVLASGLVHRVDLTEEKLYTLSEGTHAVLKKLEDPVTLQFFYSRSDASVPVPLKRFAAQVEDLLKEIAIASDGQVTLVTIDPKPDTDDEDTARELGIMAQQYDLTSPPLYFGVVANSGSESAAIPFLHSSSEPLLEYHLMRLINRAANPTRPVIGVLSSLPVLGVQPPPYQIPGQPAPQPVSAWVAFQELRRDFDVREVGATATEIPNAIDTLVMVHPKNLGDATLYAVDQFLMRGGRILAFVDPMCTADNSTPQGQFGPPQASSSLGPLLGAWGLSYSTEDFVIDVPSITQLFRNHPAGMLLRDEPQIVKDDILVAQTESLLLLFAGSFGGTPAEGLTVSPILQTSKESGAVNTFLGSMGIPAIQKEFKVGDTQLDLAVRIRGRFASAFPEGAPVAEGEAAPAGPPMETITESIEDSAVILVADVDMLIDQHTVQAVQSLFGQQSYRPFNDNLSFFLSAVEQLTDSTDLMGLRSRGSMDRAFEEVEKLKQKAQVKWLEEAKVLETRQAELRTKLRELQDAKAPGEQQQLMLSNEQEDLIASYREEEIQIGRQLRDVQKNLRKGIDRLGALVKGTTILGMPLLICMVGIGFGAYRRSHSR